MQNFRMGNAPTKVLGRRGLELVSADNCRPKALHRAISYRDFSRPNLVIITRTVPEAAKPKRLLSMPPIAGDSIPRPRQERFSMPSKNTKKPKSSTPVNQAGGRSPDKTRVHELLTKAGAGRTIWTHAAGIVLFAQGDPATAVFYLQQGKIKLTVLSKGGKEAVIAILAEGDFFGEGCLAGQPLRIATATAMTECSVMRMEKATVVKLLTKDLDFSDVVLSHVLTRSAPHRSRSCRPALQFQREAPGSRSSLTGKFREGRQTGDGHRPD